MDAKTKFAVGFVAAAAIAVSMATLGSSSSDSTSESGADTSTSPPTSTSKESSVPDRSSTASSGPEVVEETRSKLTAAAKAEPVDDARAAGDSRSNVRAATGRIGDREDVLPTPNSHGGAAWDDPTNDRVLGPKEWMAGTDDEERARIDEVFEKSRAARYDPRLSIQDRGQSVAAMRAVVDACFQALAQRVPGSSGRLIVAWTAGASGGQGRVSNPRIKVNYKLEDETFEACILDGAQNLRFDAADGEPIEVEVPFFYDGAY